MAAERQASIWPGRRDPARCRKIWEARRGPWPGGSGGILLPLRRPPGQDQWPSLRAGQDVDAWVDELATDIYGVAP